MMEEIGREILWNVGLAGRIITYILAVITMYFVIMGIAEKIQDVEDRKALANRF